MVSTYLEAAAIERLNNIRSVNPKKAESVENIIFANLQKNGAAGKVSDDQLIDLLRQVAEVDTKDSTVSFKRRAFDSDDDLDLDNLDL